MDLIAYDYLRVIIQTWNVYVDIKQVRKQYIIIFFQLIPVIRNTYYDCLGVDYVKLQLMVICRHWSMWSKTWTGSRIRYCMRTTIVWSGYRKCLRLMRGCHTWRAIHPSLCVSFPVRMMTTGMDRVGSHTAASYSNHLCCIVHSSHWSNNVKKGFKINTRRLRTFILELIK